MAEAQKNDYVKRSPSWDALASFISQAVMVQGLTASTLAMFYTAMSKGARTLKSTMIDEWKNPFGWAMSIVGSGYFAVKAYRETEKDNNIHRELSERCRTLENVLMGVESNQKKYADATPLGSHVAQLNAEETSQLISR